MISEHELENKVRLFHYKKIESWIQKETLFLKQVIEFNQLGISTTKIAKKLNCDRQTIYAKLLMYGIALENHRFKSQGTPMFCPACGSSSIGRVTNHKYECKTCSSVFSIILKLVSK